MALEFMTKLFLWYMILLQHNCLYNYGIELTQMKTGLACIVSDLQLAIQLSGHLIASLLIWISFLVPVRMVAFSLTSSQVIEN